MRVLLDECLPRRLGRLLAGHEVQTVQGMGWSSASNGEILERMAPDFDALVTMDASLVFQQDVRKLPFSVIVLSAKTNQLEDLQPLVPDVLRALHTIRPGQVAKVPG